MKMTEDIEIIGLEHIDEHDNEEEEDVQGDIIDDYNEDVNLLSRSSFSSVNNNH